MIKYIESNHPIVFEALQSSNFIYSAEEYIGSRISISPAVFSLKGSSGVMDLLDSNIKANNGPDFRLKEVIDVIGNKIDWVGDYDKLKNYTADTNNLSKIEGNFAWMGTRLYLDGVVHVICYPYPKLKIDNKWSETMLMLVIPFAYYKDSLKNELYYEAGMFEKILNRLINFYNKNRVMPIKEPISSLGKGVPYEL